MSEAGCGEPGGHAARRIPVAQRAADALTLAATPTFAVMAVLSGLPEGGHGEMPGMAGHASPLTGMVTMYVLMSVFHAAPWLRLFRGGNPTARP